MIVEIFAFFPTMHERQVEYNDETLPIVGSRYLTKTREKRISVRGFVRNSHLKRFALSLQQHSIKTHRQDITLRTRNNCKNFVMGTYKRHVGALLRRNLLYRKRTWVSSVR